MNDRELLELASRAAGIGELVYHSDVERYAVVWMPVGASRNEWAYWNPLEDDGDALRLAVKLEMDVLIWEDYVSVCAREVPELDEDARGGCIYAATRRAIVRAAAEIGKAMTGGRQ